jgi:hypothetical protein
VKALRAAERVLGVGVQFPTDSRGIAGFGQSAATPRLESRRGGRDIVWVVATGRSRCARMDAFIVADPTSFAPVAGGGGGGGGGIVPSGAAVNTRTLDVEPLESMVGGQRSPAVHHIGARLDDPLGWADVG